MYSVENIILSEELEARNSDICAEKHKSKKNAITIFYS